MSTWRFTDFTFDPYRRVEVIGLWKDNGFSTDLKDGVGRDVNFYSRLLLCRDLLTNQILLVARPRHLWVTTAISDVNEVILDNLETQAGGTGVGSASYREDYYGNYRVVPDGEANLSGDMTTIWPPYTSGEIL